MNIIDTIVEKIRSTPLLTLQPELLDPNENAREVYEDLKSKTEYRVFMEAMIILYERAVNSGSDKATSAAIMLKSYDKVLRYSIMKEVRAQLLQLGANDLEALKMSYLNTDFLEKLKESNKKVDDLKIKADEIMINTPFNQFKYSLLYAADRWGDDKDRLAVKSLVSKIKEELPKKKSKV